MNFNNNDLRETETTSIPKEWNISNLSKCLDLVIDYRGKTPKKLGGNWSTFGYRALSAKNIENGQLKNEDQINYVNEILYRKWMKDEVAKGDIILTSEAPLGEYYYWNSDEKIVLSQRLFGLRPKKNVVEPLFLYQFIKSPFFQSEIRGRETGTTVTGIRQTELLKTKVILPPISEQKSIAEILSSLDEKIELNRQININLEKIIKALFKSWFVDFEFPNKYGKPYKSDGGKMIESELGQIPEGWAVSTLGHIAENKKRGVRPNELGASTSYIGLEHMPRQSISIYEWGHAEGLESNKLEFKKGEILFGKLRPYFHKVGVAPVDGVCSTDILVIRPKEPIWNGFVLGHISSVDLINHTSAGSTGTKMPRTNWKAIAQYEITLPTNQLTDTFNNLIQPLLDKISSNIHESKTIKNICDTLLPQLMSGRLRVPMNI